MKKIKLIILCSFLSISLTQPKEQNTLNYVLFKFKQNTTVLEEKSIKDLNYIIDTLLNTPRFFEKYDLNISTNNCLHELKIDPYIGLKREQVVYEHIKKRINNNNLKIYLSPQKEEYISNLDTTCRSSGVILIAEFKINYR